MQLFTLDHCVSIEAWSSKKKSKKKKKHQKHIPPLKWMEITLKMNHKHIKNAKHLWEVLKPGFTESHDKGNYIILNGALLTNLAQYNFGKDSWWSSVWFQPQRLLCYLTEVKLAYTRSIPMWLSSLSLLYYFDCYILPSIERSIKIRIEQSKEEWINKRKEGLNDWSKQGPKLLQSESSL